MAQPGLPIARTSVSSFELFFDLVFVLTVARVGLVLHQQPDTVGVLITFLILANTWRMYAAYAWLTSRVADSSLILNLVLFVGMSAFLVMALAAPNAFGDAGLLFGLAYLVVVALYFALFWIAFPHGAGTLARVAPSNLGSAALLIAAGFVQGWADWVLWIAALAVPVVQHEAGRFGNFPFFGEMPMQAARYVERNGVVLIVALSESMFALGLSIGDRPIVPSILIAGLLTLGLAAAMWALYFVDTARESRRALEAVSPQRVAVVAERAFTYSFIIILGGVLMVSAGLADLLKAPFAPVSFAGSAFLACGAALYVVGVAALRQSVGVSGLRQWIAAATTVVLCAMGWLLGASTLGIIEVALLSVALLGLTLFTHDYRSGSIRQVKAGVS